MNKSETLARVYELIELWEKGLIPRHHEHEVHPGLPPESRENYLYFTLAPSLNFQRQSPALWKAALETWNDKETQYVFFPEKVIKTPYEKVQKDLLTYKLSLQPNKHTDIWITLCNSFAAHFESDPRKLIQKHQSCTTRIINYLKDNKKEYPYLNGSKMSNYWLYILDSYTDIQLKNKHKISIIPDTHIQQCSIHLGLTKIGDSPDSVANAWFEILSGTDIPPVELHPLLWNWSRNNFQPSI